MKSSDAKARREAWNGLVAMGPKAVPDLLLAMNQPRERSRILRLLAQIGPKAVAALMKRLSDRESGANAAEALTKVITPDFPQHVPELLGCVEKNPGARISCGISLMRACGSKAKAHIPRLLAALKSREPQVRAYAAGALGQMGSAAGGAALDLAGLLKDSSDMVRLAAARALGLIGPSAKAVLPALRAAGKDKNPDVRHEALEAIKVLNG